MRLPRNTVVFSGHQAVLTTIISIISLSLFMGASTAPVPYTHAVSFFDAAEFEWHVSRGHATFFLEEMYGLRAAEADDAFTAGASDEVAPHINVRHVQLEDILIDDLRLTEPAPEKTLRLLDLDKSLATTLSSGNASLDEFNSQLMLSWTAAEFEPVVLDSFPRIPDVDSTQRAKLLPSMPRPGPRANPFSRRNSPFFLRPTNDPVKVLVEVDSARDMVIIREVVNGKDVRIPITMTIQEYIKRRLEYERDERTRDRAAAYDTTSKQTLEELMKDLTEFDIPIPPNPLMSIFGDRSRISLRINGQVDINAGFRIESSDQQSVFLRPTQFSPSFRQRVQINLNGLVGDKLSIKADWSTDRTFDYENELKIKYTGYEDEIVQSVEAGNVTLQTPSTLIQGSGALFGLKAEFQLGPLRLTTIASQQKGSSATKVITGGSEESQFERRAWDYSDSHFFVDVAYRNDAETPTADGPNQYEAYYNYQAYGNDNKVILYPELQINQIEVWVSRPSSAGAVPDPEEREGVAFISFDSIGTARPYSADPTYPTNWQALLDPTQSNVTPVSGTIEVGKFLLWELNKDYTYNPVTGIITLNQNIQDDQVVAVAYSTQGTNPSSSNDDVVYGTFSADDRFKGRYYQDPNGGEDRPARLILKLVKPRNLVPTMETAWNQKVRSIYSLNMRNITADDIAELKIVFKEGGQPEETQLLGMQLLRMFGLDYGSGVSEVPDNKIDFLPGVTIDPTRGELIFPTLRPWDTGLKTIFGILGDASRLSELDKYTYPSVYDNTKTEARKSNRDKIYITGRTRGSSNSTFQLGFNIVPGSVQVILNGTPLAAGTDYKVDENVGTITIMKPEALVPGADLVINYEKQDLFSFASKTLVGARGDIDLGKESHLGFTYLSLNQQTLSDKVRIGDEPVSNTMFGIDGRTTMDMPIITEALNTLPFLRTKEKSTLTAQGEFAMVMPGEDSKSSPIPSDGGKGIAYIDDFEGTRIFIPLQTAYNVWKIGSVPDLLPNLDPTATDSTSRAQLINQKRAKLNWYNIPISGDQSRAVNVKDIWPDRQAAREDQRVTVLDLDFYPLRRGPYNYRPTVDQGTGADNWGSIMRYLPVNANNLVDGNYNFIELWMKVDDQRVGGKMLIDLGKVSEDVIPDGQLQTEDAVVYGFNGRDGVLKEEEDVGLDMLTNAEEQQRYAAEIAQYNLDPDDPSGDNYAGAPNWDLFNGSEGSLNGFNGQFPDTEDLNKNSILDLTNEYFQYEVDLDSATFNPDPNGPITKNRYVVGGGSNGWYQFRIPLSNADNVVGSPTLTNVEFIRVTFTGVDGTTEEPFRVRIAEFNFVGNQWLETYRDDPYFGVTVVNIEDNPNEYTTPPGVIRPRDRTRPDQEIYGNEQSLALVFNELPGDTVRTAYRLFPGQRGLDLFNYERLKLYVHGDPDLSGTPYYFILRFGIDDSAYYEYGELVYPGWDARNEVDINFAELTAIKASETYDANNETREVPVPGKPDAWFKVKGTPDVVNVRFISAGIRNDASNGPLSGEVWINEMRVVAPKLDIGYAYGGSVALRIADVADVSASMNYTDPNFHGISERFSASRAWVTNWSLSSTLHISKIFPESWKGTQARVTYSHTENLNKPKLMPGQPDVEVERVVEAIKQKAIDDGETERQAELLALNARVATQTLRITDSWTIPTLQFKAPGESWLIQDIFNKLTFNYNYTTSRFRDPTIRNLKRWEWNFGMGYGYEFGRDFYIQPFTRVFDGVPVLEDFIDAKWFYLPTRIGLNADLKRSRTEEFKRDDNAYLPFTREFLHKRAAQLGFVLSEGSLLNIDGSYNTSLMTSLLSLEAEYERDSEGRIQYDQNNIPNEVQRQSSAIFSEMFFGRGGLYFGEPLRYDQSVTLNSRPWIPSILDLDRNADLSLGYTVNYFWQTNLQQKELGRSAGFNANSSASLNFKLKAFTDPWFPQAGGGAAGQNKGGPGGRRGGQQPPQQDEPKESPEEVAEREAAEKARASYDPETAREALLESMNRKFDSLSEEERANPVRVQEFETEVQRRLDSLEQHIQTVMNPDQDDANAPGFKLDFMKALSDAAYYAIKIPLLDYDNVNFTFSQTSASQVSGIVGQTGFSAFWTTDPFSGTSAASLGPSRLYQLGLISDPNPLSGQVETTSQFPYLGISNYRRGLRAPNPGGNYVDNFNQSSSFTTKTNRPLWEGANLDLSWSVRWSINKNYQLTTDDVGRQSITSTTSTGQIQRSYMAFPDFLFFSAFNTNIEAVSARFEELKADPTDTRTESEKLFEAFEDGFEALPWLSDVLGQFMPRMNWGIRWDGIEKISLFDGIADRISMDHRYNSTLSSNYEHSADNGARITKSKRVESGFSPLIGVNMGWDDIWEGSMSVTANWNKTVGYNLTSSASNIQREARDELSVTANFRKNGFEMPFLGLTLKNDVEFSLAFSYSANRQRTFEISNLAGGGQPREGTIQYTIEPRMRYSISSRVNASIFYRYQRTKPDEDSGSSIPGTTVHEAGLELKISISG